MAAPAHALVLTAGFGTRLRPLTLSRAKPAIPVGGEPMIRRILRWLGSHGVSDAVLNLHYLPETLTAVVGDGSDLGVRVCYSWEQPQILGSAGGARQALGIIGAETFLIVNGDTLTDVDLTKMAEAHERSGALVTLALVAQREPGKYGGVRLDDRSRVVDFVPRGSTQSSFHFVGVQIVHASVFCALPADTPAYTIGGVYDELTRTDGNAVKGFVSDANFWDVGTPTDYWTTTLAMLPTASAGAGRRAAWGDLEVSPERDRIDRFLNQSGLGRKDSRVVPLTGDASDRRYFRIIAPESDPLVLAVHNGPIEFATLAFANVARLLQQIPLPIPAILGHSDELGIVALEDLGDVTLQAHLGAQSPGQHAAHYRQAVALIELLQRRGAELASSEYVPYQMAFDVEKLTWELNFFVRHFIEGYRGSSMSEIERRALDEEWAAIAGELAAEPRVLCHRDYHSRNLMVHRDSLYIIDFQDARLGPDTYDLASLVRDSYVDIADRELDDLIAYFLALKGRTEIDDFRCRFDVMAVQRNLKALGTFGYQTTTRRNPVYIQYIPRTLRYARTNLEKYPRFARLRELLARHVEEFR